MKITILGSASGQAVPHRNASALLVESKQGAFLIDSGDGVAQQLVRYKMNPNKIQCIYISHTHPDHVGGLFMLLQLMYLMHRRDPIKIYLPEGVLPGFRMILPYFYIYEEKWTFPFSFHAISDNLELIDHTFHIRGIQNKHLDGNRRFADPNMLRADSYSFIFHQENGDKTIYTSDIDSLQHLYPIKDEISLLISECTHVNVDEVLEYADMANIHEVVFTHIPTDFDTLTTTSYKSIKVHYAKDGDSFQI